MYALYLQNPAASRPPCFALFDFVGIASQKENICFASAFFLLAKQYVICLQVNKEQVRLQGWE